MSIKLGGVRCRILLGLLPCTFGLCVTMPAQSAASCANTSFTGFQTFLANCGSYEQVTPTFKDGAKVHPVALGASGARVIGESVGIFGGIEGDSFLTLFESVRSSTGWATAAINPPSATFPAQGFLDADASFGTSLWEARRSTQSVAAEDLYIREQDGVFVEVGPVVPPSASEGPPAGQYQSFVDNLHVVYTGASHDLSHVFFQIRGNGPLWPGDTTDPEASNRSLYEYVGVHNLLPQRVGVDEQGAIISDCGISLGSVARPEAYSADTYNAISQNGEVVFFTALSNRCAAAHAPSVDEVYARIGQGVTARTVSLSEPSRASCEACQTELRAAAEFQGASSDGSKAFFISEQELFSGNATTNLYEYDFSNRPGHKLIQISTRAARPEVQGVARVSEDGSHVYFVARGILTEGINAEGAEPMPGGENLYVYERDAAHRTGQLTFVATLSEADSEDWSARDIRPVQATPDGRFLIFPSHEHLTNGDQSTASQLFEYDAANEQLVRISVGESGYQGGMESANAAASSITPQSYSGGLAARTPTLESAISPDGAAVVFQSTGGLTRQAAAAGKVGQQSVYLYRSTGSISNGRVFSVSDGSSSFSAFAAGMDASGQNVFFETATPILGSDGDTQIDLYDARDDGGFLAPPVVTNCEMASTCHGSPGEQPPAPAVLSTGPPASGNPTPPTASEKSHVASRLRILAKALKACRKQHGAQRRKKCEKRARARVNASPANGGGSL